MSPLRFIPRRVFQAIALLLLVICLALTVYWVAEDEGPYAWFRDVLGRRLVGLAILLTFLTLFACWLVVVVPLRKLSTMPTLAEEIGQPVGDWKSLVSGLKRLYAREAAKNEAMYRAGEPPAPEMKQRARQIGVGFVIAGIGSGAAAALSAMVSLQWD